MLACTRDRKGCLDDVLTIAAQQTLNSYRWLWVRFFKITQLDLPAESFDGKTRPKFMRMVPDSGDSVSSCTVFKVGDVFGIVTGAGPVKIDFSTLANAN